MKVPRVSDLVAIMSAGVVVAAIVAGLVVIPSPAEQRVRRRDARRLSDLRSIQRAVDLYWTRHDRLPASLEALSVEPGVVIARDPATGESYEFRVTGDTVYEICATFEATEDDLQETIGDRFWAHGPGRTCFHPPVTRVDPSGGGGPNGSGLRG